RSMANEGAWRLNDVAPEALPSALEELSEAVVLADSLWLNDVHLPHFLRLKQRGARVGLVLHALPSMIAAADAGRPVSAEASAFELAGLKQFDFIVVLGQHFRDCLEQAGVPVVNCPPGVSTKFRFKPQARSTCCRFLSLAALTPLKGLCDAADIFSTWPMQPAFEWLVLGSTSVDH